MKHNTNWQLTEEIRKTINNNKASNKTLWSKVKTILDENEDLFKYREHESISSQSLERLNRSKRCFEFLKSGFFRREELSGFYLISEIKSFNSYVGGNFEMKLKDETILKITEQDYKDLEYLFNN